MRDAVDFDIDGGGSGSRRRTGFGQPILAIWMNQPGPTGFKPDPNDSNGVWIPLGLLLVLVGIELWVLLAMNDGVLVYTLDDPYIHFALAENILAGHYGVSPIEFSAPSSTFLWPIILAPFTAFQVFDYVPFVVNVFAAAATVWFYHSAITTTVSPGEGRKRYPVALIFTCLLIPTTNLVGLIFTGMEHSLQVLLAVMVVCGLIVEARTGRTPRWLLVAIVVGPLVRYESLAVATPALAYLLLRGHIRPALVSAALIMFFLGAFSLFLHSNGVGWLPVSVNANSSVISSPNSVDAVFENLSFNLKDSQSISFSVALVVLLMVSLLPGRNKAERLFALGMAVSIALHLLLGSFGAFYRYEVYAWASAFLATIYVLRGAITFALDRMPLYVAIALSVILFVAAGPGYWLVPLVTPLASNNIYEQQYQMHRFTTEFYKAPVGVNDLGWVTYRNEHYVLDLWGLASKEALVRRRQARGTNWMNKLTRKHDVRLVMLYEHWFKKLPEDWRALGKLHLGKRRITPASSAVAFYVLDAEAEEHARTALSDFQQVLPSGVRFEFAAQ